MNIFSHLSLIKSKLFIKSNQSLCLNQQNNLISKYLLNTDKSVLIGRLGFTEGRLIGNFLSPYYDKSVDIDAVTESGVFPCSKLTTLSCVSEQLNALKNTDILAVWPVPYLCQSLKFSDSKAKFIDLETLNILNVFNQSRDYWSKALSNQKILVVSPFKKTILNNYQNKFKIPLLSDILPNLYSLNVIKAPFGSFSEIDEKNKFSGQSWFRNLNDLKIKISREEFDICILGCGAYGFPLASFIKTNLNKKALHLGGAHQLLFGIKGGRWLKEKKYNSIKKYLLEWQPPLQEEMPVHPAKAIEIGAYI